MDPHQHTPRRSQIPLGEGQDSFLEIAGELSGLDDVRLPGEKAPPLPSEDSVDEAELAALENRLSKFASGVSVSNKRHEIRKIASGPPVTLGPPSKRPPPRLKTTAKKLSEDETADKLAGLAERVAVRARDPRIMALVKEGAKQAILDNINPMVSLTTNLAEAGHRLHELRHWNDMSDSERVLQMAGLAGNVAEVLSTFTPPPAGPALKFMGLGLGLIRAAAEKNEEKPKRPSARRGTQMLSPPAARSRTQRLTPPPQMPPRPARPVAKTGPLQAPAPPPVPPPEENPVLMEKLKGFAKTLKDLKGQWF